MAHSTELHRFAPLGRWSSTSWSCTVSSMELYVDISTISREQCPVSAEVEYSMGFHGRTSYGSVVRPTSGSIPTASKRSSILLPSEKSRMNPPTFSLSMTMLLIRQLYQNKKRTKQTCSPVLPCRLFDQRMFIRCYIVFCSLQNRHQAAYGLIYKIYTEVYKYICISTASRFPYT